MMISSLFVGMRVPAVSAIAMYLTALRISCLVTFIAAYYYMQWRPLLVTSALAARISISGS